MIDRAAYEIRRLAEEEALSAEARKAELHEQKREWERKLSDMDVQLKEAILAPERLANFRVEISGRYQCPSCWIRSGKVSDLSEIRVDDGNDTFRCRGCGLDLVVGG